MRRLHLFEKHPFLAGAASVADLLGTVNRPITANLALIFFDPIERRGDDDAEALYNDWLALGDDFRAAIKLYEQMPDHESMARQEPLFELA